MDVVVYILGFVVGFVIGFSITTWIVNRWFR